MKEGLGSLESFVKYCNHASSVSFIFLGQEGLWLLVHRVKRDEAEEKEVIRQKITIGLYCVE